MAKVFLTAGHGGSDPGACAYGMKEKDINLNIMLACKGELERHGVEVICSRTKDENDPVQDETKEANASKADIAVSFHTNAGGGDGSETYYYGSSNEGKRLAELCEKYTKGIGQNSRGIKSGNKLMFIRRTNMPAVLCECAFIDNDNDNNIIDNPDKQRAFGIAYAKAILEYFGIAYLSTNKVETKVEDGSFKVKVEISTLNIRRGPGTNYEAIGTFTGRGVFTITEVREGMGSNSGWGRLKSGAGWISLDFAKRI